MYLFDEIREHYKHLTPIIMSNSSIDVRKWVYPYSRYLGWETMFSPIEEATWQTIRSFWQVPLYPQYPVSKYFIDFGNPYLKIGFECDGKEWHQDKEKDNNRDIELQNEGWYIFRVTGSECMKLTPEYDDRYSYEEDDYEVQNILYEFYKTSDGVLKAIGYFFFNYNEYYYFETEIKMALHCLLNHISPVQKERLSEYLSKKMCDLYDKYYENK